MLMMKNSEIFIDEGQYVVLIVDDDLSILETLAETLELDSYAVICCNSPSEALTSIIPNNKIDMVISDINMPEMSGFQLLKKVKFHFPKIKRVLITGEDIENHLDCVIQHDIGNIFVKDGSYAIHEFRTLVKKLLTNDIFGVDKYLTGKEINKEMFKICSSKDIDDVASAISELVGQRIPDTQLKMELVLVELFTNAVFYGARSDAPDEKDQWDHTFSLPVENSIEVLLVEDCEKIVVSITDNGGKLKKKDVLFWLNRQVQKSEDGIPIGAFDTHGRGLFFVRKYIDRLLINVQSGEKTEIIIMNYFNPANVAEFKPLHINEL